MHKLGPRLQKLEGSAPFLTNEITLLYWADGTFIGEMYRSNMLSSDQVTLKDGN
tara:strand:- start:936 stop:1097 length:162 start_codon:yes stop_codon:yes gene_type:complete